MSNIVINGVTYSIYGDYASATNYLAAAVGSGPDAWNALTDDDTKAKYLVAAKRILDRQGWQGTKTVSNQTDAWPRSGVSDKEGTAVDSATVPANVTNAEYELAAILVANPTVNSQRNTGSNIQMLKAGPVDVAYFRPTDGTAGSSSKFPTEVMDLIGQYLASATSAGAAAAAYNSDSQSTAFDSCKESSFSDCATYDRVWPF